MSDNPPQPGAHRGLRPGIQPVVTVSPVGPVEPQEMSLAGLDLIPGEDFLLLSCIIL